MDTKHNFGLAEKPRPQARRSAALSRGPVQPPERRAERRIRQPARRHCPAGLRQQVVGRPQPIAVRRPADRRPGQAVRHCQGWTARPGEGATTNPRWHFNESNSSSSKLCAVVFLCVFLEDWEGWRGTPPIS